MPALRFARLDANGDGGVSLDEMRTRFAQLTQERFQRMDADGNGLLSKEEMAGMRAQLHKRHHMRYARPDEEAPASSAAQSQQ